MTTADLLAILRYNGSSVDILQDFTADRSHLLSILQTMVVGEGQEGAEAANDDSSADTGAAFGQDDSEFNIFTTDRQLAALQTAAEALGRLNEKKSLIYFASGLNLNGLDNQAQLVATEQAAIRAGVSFWPIDARGLVASGPLGDATQGSQGGSAMYTGGAAMAVMSRFARSQDTLFALAGDTGGKALLDNNDLDRGIVNAQHADSDYYILGYYTSNTAVNGKFRKVVVSLVPPQQAADLDFRHGYFGEKEWGKFTTADKERQLEDALMQGDPWVDLTVAVEINYFQLNKAEYYVPVFVKVPGREIVLARRGGADHTHIDLVGEIKDDYGGTTVSNIRDHFDTKLSDATATEWAKRPIVFSSGYTLLPGKYTIKVLARDDETGRIGTFQTSFVIPNLNKETKRVAISSVVLSGQRQPYANAIYNVANGKEQAKQAAADPLVQNGQQLVPSVTRVFSKGAQPVCVPAGIRAGGGDRSAADGLCELLSGAGEGVRDAARGGVSESEQEPADRSAQLHGRSGPASAGQVRLPGECTGSDGSEGSILAGADPAGAVMPFCCVGADGTLPLDDAKQRGCGNREARGDAAHKSDRQKQNPTRRRGFAGPETRRFGTRRAENCKWLRGKDLNLRPLGYEPNELPGCSTPQRKYTAVERDRSNLACGWRAAGWHPTVQEREDCEGQTKSAGNVANGEPLIGGAGVTFF